MELRANFLEATQRYFLSSKRVLRSSARRASDNHWSRRPPCTDPKSKNLPWCLQFRPVPQYACLSTPTDSGKVANRDNRKFRRIGQWLDLQILHRVKDQH